jgi:hypothetical protein
LADADPEIHHEAVSDREEYTEELRRGADESAARQAELRARAERVIQRGDFIEQVRRGAAKSGLRTTELRTRLERLRSGAPVTAEDVAAATAASATARGDAAHTHERGAEYHELAGYVHEAAAEEHEQAVREGVGDPAYHARRAKELRAAAAAERALSEKDRQGAEEHQRPSPVAHPDAVAPQAEREEPGPGTRRASPADS